jgi:signal transduction histidine kinase/CheY-like chemotaxis protein/HAMP domain-containing protein
MVLLLVPALIISLVPIVLHLQQMQRSTLADITGIANRQYDILQLWARTTSGKLKNAVDDPTLRVPSIQVIITEGESNSVREFSSQTEQLFVTKSIFDRVLLVNADGTLLSSNDLTMLRNAPNFASEKWLQEGLLSSGDVVILGPLRDPVDGVESLYFTVPLRSTSAGSPLGVISGRMRADTLSSLILNLPISGQSGEYFLVTEGRRYVTPPFGSPTAVLATDEIVADALAAQSGSGIWRDFNGDQVIGAYRWVDELHMSLVISQKLAVVTAAASEGILTQLVISGFVLMVALAAGLMISRRLTDPLEAISALAIKASRGDFKQQADTEMNILELNQIGESFNRLLTLLRTQNERQEELISSRTRQLELTAQIGRVLAAETNLEQLLRLTIDMIKDQLGYYHAQVFMLDDLRQYAVLRASTGVVGQELLAAGHKLQVGSQSVIGQTTARNEPVLVRDTDNNPIHSRNRLLPDTRAELSVPLQLGGQVIGALDVQSTSRDAFDEGTIVAFQTIADQLAVAIRNTELFREKEGLLSASVQLTQTLTRDNWSSYLSQKGEASPGFTYDLSDVQPLIGEQDDSGNGHGVNVPITLRGEIIGNLQTNLQEGHNLTEEDKNLVGQVLDRVAMALENARLFDQTQFSLMEANRLYLASQVISSAATIGKLITEVIGLLKLDTVDRVLIVSMDELETGITTRWSTLLGRWARNLDDPLMNLPERLTFDQLPALVRTNPDAVVGGSVMNFAGGFIGDPDTASLLLETYQVKALAEFPLIAGGRTQGWLILHSTSHPQAFSESDRRFLSSITDQTSTALESLRLSEQTHTRVRRLQATNEVSRAASSILNPDILLPLTVNQISEAFGYYHAQVFLIDELGQWAILRASTGEVGQELLKRGHKLEVGGQSVIGQVTARGEPVIARDTDVDAIHRRNELLPNTRAEMAIPLKTGDRVIGALDVQSTQVNAFDAEAQVILQSLADQISVTLENAQLFQEIQDRVAELTTVNLVSQAVSRAETLSDLYEVVSTQLIRTFGATHAILAVLSPNGMIHLPIFLEGGELLSNIEPMPVGQGITSHVLRTREVLLINENMDSAIENLGARVIGVRPKSLLAVPLLLGDEAVGAISIQDPEREHAYNETHVRQMTTLAAYIAIKIRNAELLEEAQQRAGELGFLFDITRMAVSSTDLDEALTSVDELISREIKGAEAVMVYLAEEGSMTLTAHSAVGYGRDFTTRKPILNFTDFPKQIVEGTESLLLHDAQSDPHFARLDERSHAVMMIPLWTAGTLSGVLMVASTQATAFSEQDMSILNAASSTLTAIIQNARLLDQITQANSQLRELDKLKSQFLANMSHELRTPLNSIIGFSRVMLKGIDGPLNDMQTQDLTTIYQSGNHLLGLINDILDVSKIEAGKMEVQPEYTSASEIVDGVMATGKGLVKDKSIQLFKELEPDLPQFYGDPVRVRQVLLNLVSNAAKFTQEGSITIHVHKLDANRETGEAACLQFDVKDTGIGIAPKDRGKLFEAFSQVDGSTTRQVGGTGLGLAISRQFIELHGGRIWLESEVGKGSVFSFIIPLHPPSPAGESSATPAMSASTANGHSIVITVDDEPGVIDLYTRYLEKAGYGVVGLSSGTGLPDYVREHHPVAILLDLNMPGVNGWAALDELKAHEDTRTTPVIVCSIEDQRTRASSLGVREYLIKPILEEDLLAALARAVAGTSKPLYQVLIIHPDPNRAESIRQVLVEKGGYGVHVVTQGFAGLQALSESHPSAVILDFGLSDMDGYGLLLSMRSQPDIKHIPVLALTNRSLSDSEMGHINPELTRVISSEELDLDDLHEALITVLAGKSIPA